MAGIIVLIFREMVILLALQSREASSSGRYDGSHLQGDGHPPCPPVQGGPHKEEGMMALILREMVILLALQSGEVLIKWQV